MIFLFLWAALQILTVVGVILFLKYIPTNRQSADPGGVVIIVSTRADWPNSNSFMKSIEAQRGVRFRMILVHPNTNEDPPWLQDALSGVYRVDLQILRAESVANEGQKIHKLRTALRHLTPEDRYLVFLDTDIDPPTNLIGRLVFPLATKKSQISTGYRLSLPRSAWPLPAIIAAIDLQIATLPRPRKGTLPWGGAMALTREVCDALDLELNWKNCLSDDLTLARLASSARVAVRPVRDVLLPSLLSSEDAWDFAIRQYRHLYCNLPQIWFMALIIVATHVLCWLYVFLYGGWVAAFIGYVAAWMRVALRLQVVQKIVDKSYRRALGKSLLWDAIAPFAIISVHLLIIIVSGFSRTIIWGNFKYKMKGGRVVSAINQFRL